MADRRERDGFVHRVYRGGSRDGGDMISSTLYVLAGATLGWCFEVTRQDLKRQQAAYVTRMAQYQRELRKCT